MSALVRKWRLAVDGTLGLRARDDEHDEEEDEAEDNNRSPPAKPPVLVCPECPTVAGSQATGPLSVVTVTPPATTLWMTSWITVAPTVTSTSISLVSATSASAVTTPQVVNEPVLASQSLSSTSSATRAAFTPSGRPQRENEDEPPPSDMDDGDGGNRRTLAIAMGVVFGVAVLSSVLFCVYMWRRRRAKRLRREQTTRALPPPPPPILEDQRGPVAQPIPRRTESSIVNQMMTAVYATEQGGYAASDRSSQVSDDEYPEKPPVTRPVDTRSFYSYATSRTSRFSEAPSITPLQMPPQHPSRSFSFLQQPPPTFARSETPRSPGGLADVISLYGRSSRVFSWLNRRPSQANSQAFQEVDSPRTMGPRQI